MAMSQLDKFKLMGVINRTKINDYNDLHIDSRSKLNIYDFLDAALDIAIKFINEKQTEKSVLNAIRAVEVVLMQMYATGLEIDEQYYNKILKIKELSSYYNSEEINQRFLELSNIYQSSFIGYIDEEKMEEAIEEVEEPEEVEYVDVTQEMLELKRTIENYENQMNNLNRELQKAIFISEKNKKDYESKKRELNTAKTRITQLTKELVKAQNAYNELIRKYNQALADLKSKEKERAKFEKEASETKRVYRQQIQVSSEQTAMLDSMKNKETLINEVFDIITSGRSTINDISKILRSKGIKVTLNEITLAIQELKKTYEVDDSILKDFNKAYLIVSKKVPNNRIFTMNNNKKSLEFIIVSDVHIASVRGYIINAFDKIYDYLVNNGINTIINLGDFIAYNYLSNSSVTDRLRYNDSILNNIISAFPFQRGIKHLILGGNHEEKITPYGIDPIEFLDLNREDFISLGYRSAFLNFNGSYMGLFHPHFRLNNEKNVEETLGQLNNYVKDKYAISNISRDEVFINLFGHFHLAKIYDKSMVTVPSITRDRYTNGAWHAKVNFNPQGSIKNIELTELTIGKKIYEGNTYELKRKFTE